MNRRSFLSVCAGGVAASVCHSSFGQSTESDARERVRRIEGAISGLMERERVPGLQIALVHDRSIAWTGAYGVLDLATGDAVDDQSVFEAASLTKPVFSTVVMNLVDRGMLDLDVPLLEYGAPVLDAEPRERLELFTARHVLTHSTGLPNWHVGNRPAPIRTEPGKAFSYSGMAFEYLQHVVESLTDMPLASLLNDGLFSALGMESASLLWRDDYEARLARGHSANPRSGRLRKASRASAASSLVCNAEDYARFVVALLDPPRAADAAVIDRMFEPQIEAAEDVWWGLGWGLERPDAGETSFWHWGNNNGFYNAFVCASQATGHGIVVMTNSGNGLRLCRDLVPLVLGGDHPAFRWNMVVPQVR